MSRACRSVLLLVVCCLSSAGQSLPHGFVDQLVVGGFTWPIALSHLPDGRTLVIERESGNLYVVSGAQRSLVGTVPNVRTVASEGLRALAVDPEWPDRPYVYVQYSYDAAPVIHVTRFEVLGDLQNVTSTNLSLGPAYFVLTDIPDSHPDHNGGSLRFGQDGFLYISNGDDRNECASRDPAVLTGNLLRISVAQLPAGGGGPPAKSLLVPPGNPWSGPNDNARLSWAVGLRNPFRMHLDPIDDAVLFGDVGDGLFDEINASVASGLDFGWPLFEGPQALSFTCSGTPPPLTLPVVSIDHMTLAGAASAMTLAVYRTEPGTTAAFGPGYEGNLFYLDYFAGFVRRLVRNGNAWVLPPQVPGQPNSDDWATGYLGVTDGAVGADGGLYYVNHVQGELRVIRRNVSGSTLSLVSGGNQIATFGEALSNPLVVRLLDGAGMPQVGVPIMFADQTGGSTFGPQPVLTDANGEATTTCHLGAFPPLLNASTSGGLFVGIDVAWRGLGATAAVVAGQRVMLVGFVHTQTNSPFTLAIEPAGVTTPIPTFAGSVVTSIFNLHPTTVLLDGLGIVGPPLPGLTTGPIVPSWEYLFQGIPSWMSGMSLVLQGYALDLSLPFPTGYFVSNPVSVLIP